MDVEPRKDDPVGEPVVRSIAAAKKTSRSGQLSRTRSEVTAAAPAAAAPAPVVDKDLLHRVADVMSRAVPLWVWNYLKSIANKQKRPLPPYDGSPGADRYRMPNKCKIAMAGDWGAGTICSRRVAAAMAAHQPEITIHLGDVYYSGTHEEYAGIFLGGTPGRWPVGSRGTAQNGESGGLYVLNGNHEMYSGGEAYFGDLVGVNRPKGFGQRASYFCLENDHLRIIGLDTGYNTPARLLGDLFKDKIFKISNTIPEENERWLRDVVFRQGDRQVPSILLSHHQPIYGYGRAYGKLRKQMTPFLDHILLWFWGHEHRLTLQAAVDVEGKLLRGRCIGNGGKPVEIDLEKQPNKKHPVAFTDVGQHVVEGQTVGFCGYVILDLEDAALTVSYYREPEAGHPATGADGLGPISPEDPILVESWDLGSAPNQCRGFLKSRDSSRTVPGNAAESQLFKV